MKLEIKKAFQSPFSSEKWYIKLIFPVVMMALGYLYTPSLHIPKIYLLIIFLISAIPSLVLYGFYFQFQHNEINNELPLLPELKSKVQDYLKYGFISLGFVIFYVLLMFLSGASLLVAAKFGGLIGIILGITSIVSLIFFVLFSMFATTSYADKFCFKDAFDFKRLSNLMSKVRLEIFICVLLFFAISMITSSFKPVFVIVFFLQVLFQFVWLNLIAQIYKIAKFRLENTEQ